MGAEDWATSSASCRTKDAERARIQADVEAFLKSGRTPTQCQFGETAEHGKPYNPSKIPDPTVTHKRAAGKANQAHGQKKAAIGRTRMTTNHIEILRASVDLRNRGLRATLINISRATGQIPKDTERRIDVLVVRGYINQDGRQFITTANGLEYIGERAAE